MSKITFEIDVDRYICTELQAMRTMHETRDYSRLLAAVERVQQHADAMEDALYASQKAKEWLKDNTNNHDLDNNEFRSEAEKLLKEL